MPNINQNIHYLSVDLVKRLVTLAQMFNSAKQGILMNHSNFAIKAQSKAVRLVACQNKCAKSKNKKKVLYILLKKMKKKRVNLFKKQRNLVL